MPPKRGKPNKQHKKPLAKAIALGRGKRSKSPKRKSASPERTAGEKSPSKTAAGRDEATKKVAKAKKSVSFVSSDDDDLPKLVELETLKGAKSSEKDIEIPRKKAPKSDTDNDMTVADDDDTDDAGIGDVMALGSTELTAYLLNKHSDRAADGMQPSRAALWLLQALSLRCNPEAHEEVKVLKETLSTMKQAASASAPRVLFVMDCPRGNADYAIMLSTLLNECHEELAFLEGVLPEAAEYVLREMLHAYSTSGLTVELARDKIGEDSP